ncbi:hypothetical protein ACTJIJ_24515 [Niabella sp. 22666]|uniref:hypothetical protein n=1 Tax=Niabella sp. 22666 TaxID=3453954 RepID=UPI003F8377A1
MSLMASCRLPKPKLQYENITINIPGAPGRLIQHEGKFYGYFVIDNDYFSTQGNQHFYNIDEKGAAHILVVPPELDSMGYQLLLQNDSIFIKGDEGQHTYYLDKTNGSWVAANNEPQPLYEDDRFAVYAIDRGEWGGNTWFRDKRTDEQYEVSATDPVVTFYKNTYYLTTKDHILKVSDPMQLKRSIVKYDYHKVGLAKDRYGDEPYSDKGITIAYEGKRYLELIPETVLITSFAAGNELYHLYEDSMGAAIGTLRFGKLEPVHRFEPGLKLYRYYNSLEYPVQDNGKQLIGFSTSHENQYGIIIIDSGCLKMTRFTNNFKEPVYDTAAIKDWVEKSLMDY